jgi:hypothetical protein
MLISMNGMEDAFIDDNRPESVVISGMHIANCRLEIERE